MDRTRLTRRERQRLDDQAREDAEAQAQAGDDPDCAECYLPFSWHAPGPCQRPLRPATDLTYCPHRADRDFLLCDKCDEEADWA